MLAPFYEEQAQMFRIGETSTHAFPPHMHSHVEILWVLHGCAVMAVNGQKITLHKGDCAVIFANVVHSYEPMQDNNRVMLSLFSLSMAGHFRHSLLNCHPAIPFVAKQNLHPDAVYALHALHKEAPQPDKAACAALFQLLLARLFPCFQLEKNSECKGDSLLLQKIISYLMEHYSQPIQLAGTAQTLGVSQYQLSRLFTGTLHISFTRYLQELRVQKAKSLLLSTNSSVLSIALECGFENPRSFNRVFLALTGVSPREYRKQEGANELPLTAY